MPATRDAGSYIWGFWWMAHQVEHLSNPWFSRYIAAPVGAPLGLHALMPLPDVLMMPATVAFGPGVSYNLLSVAVPGLSSYAAYRVARLWLPSQAGAIAAGAFFGLSSMLTWRAWYHLNLAAGAVFFPLALEAAVRLVRRPSRQQAAVLGLVIGGALLTDPEMAVLVVVVAGLALVPWVLEPPRAANLGLAAVAALTAALFAAPQITAIAAQVSSGGATASPHALGADYVGSSVNLEGMFALSPRVRDFGLGHLGIVDNSLTRDGIHTFGLILTLLALAGLFLARRRKSAWLLTLLWAGCAALAFGPGLRVGSPYLHPRRGRTRRPAGIGDHAVHLVRPAPAAVRIPRGESDHDARHAARRPAGRCRGGLVARSRRAGGNRCRRHRLSGARLGRRWPIGTVPTALPAVDRAIAADRSHSIVVDVPYGIRGGTNWNGLGFDPDAQVLATADGHPRAVGFISRISPHTLAGLNKDPFYTRLLATQAGYPSTPAQLIAARDNARRLDIGWVLLWSWLSGHSPAIRRYVRETGFRLDYSANGVQVYRATSTG